MKTIILEGIATSGKSSITNQLRSSLGGDMKVVVAEEEETHMPINESTEDLHIGFYKKLIDKLSQKQPELLIINRFYFTQAFRAKATLADYKEIEEALSPLNPTTILLKVDPGTIQTRVKNAINHRDPEWGKYVLTKGETPQEQAEYYVAQQESLLILIESSTLPYKIFDTTAHNYKEIAEEILTYMDLNQNNRGDIKNGLA